MALIIKDDGSKRNNASVNSYPIINKIGVPNKSNPTPNKDWIIDNKKIIINKKSIKIFYHWLKNFIYVFLFFNER